ncbi:MAG: ABC transporter ATP-binding protein [Alphaproteobacteria bacterium]|nr:ABC transporter ATP-binding protein [Alphaproteobacteria bacterium]MBT4966095.1 ABC transporter ATP-binding protein [Alphaproteobacteria bacterium]MBT5159445.1 ABC transporter ATP-binding protein [Alphaproteobacteria bacterium]MBT5920352.1 ABC transporter ATP-binding protein [Alphaproteobacteria bacterium]MBT6387261.1 ABC transporter ATP-binding protein [Alphaproteobacteria bacterium]
MNQRPLLEVDDLAVRFYTLRGTVHALEDVSFKLGQGESVGLVGETGCGKSLTARAILRIISPPGKIIRGHIRFEDKQLLELSEKEIRDIRGNQISMIMQEPKMSLNPSMRVGKQVAETLMIHDRSLGKRAAMAQALDMLNAVSIPDPGHMSKRFPHELSGGMAQRIMIAMMLVTRPKLLIADEPTSALDVTIQAQIIDLINGLIEDIGSSVLMISHDLGVVAETCDRVIVMYAGSVAESGLVEEVMENPQHPYTQGLLRTLPDAIDPGQPLYSIKGTVPNLLEEPLGCRFAPRCPQAMDRCFRQKPPVFDVGPGHQVACFLHETSSPQASASSGPSAGLEV